MNRAANSTRLMLAVAAIVLAGSAALAGSACRSRTDDASVSPAPATAPTTSAGTTVSSPATPVPDSTSPATTEPEPTEPEPTDSPATTVPDPTVPDTTVPDPTVPEPTVPDPTTTAMPSPVYDPYAGTRAATAPVGAAVEAELRTGDGRTRRYRVYVPSTLQADTGAPLLIALHGGGGSAAQFELNSGFDGLAEANGFIVVYPDGISALPNGTGPQTWNGGYCCGPAVNRNVDDVGFIRQLIDALGSRYRIDPARIYAAGHSNGGILSYRLACELADTIVAIGVQAGSLGIDACAPARPVSVFHLHGTADTNHPIDGGRGSGVAGVDFRPARGSVEALAVANRCTGTPTSASTPDNRDLVTTTWTGCDDGVEVRYVVVDGATHAWMGRPGVSPGAAAYVGEPYPDLDASRAIWSFLTSHPRP